MVPIIITLPQHVFQTNCKIMSKYGLIRVMQKQTVADTITKINNHIHVPWHRYMVQILTRYTFMSSIINIKLYTKLIVMNGLEFETWKYKILSKSFFLILVNTEPNMYKLNSARSDILKSKNSCLFLYEGLVVGWSVCDISKQHSALIFGAKESTVPEDPDL
jgi:hypothetical protein